MIDACKYYFSKTGRRVTFEYSLVAGVNDTKEDAEELSRLIHGDVYKRQYGYDTDKRRI